MRISDWSSDVCSSDLRLQCQTRTSVESFSLVVFRHVFCLARFCASCASWSSFCSVSLDGCVTISVSKRVADSMMVMGGSVVPRGLCSYDIMRVSHVEGDRQSTRLNSSH